MEDQRSRLQIFVLLSLAVMTILFGAVLIVSHLCFRGAVFSDTLLMVKTEGTASVYTGRMGEEDVSIRVEPEGANRTRVDYRVGDRVEKSYTVEYPTETQVVIPERGEHVNGIRIWCNGALVFEGGLDSDWEYGWYDLDGSWIPDFTISVSTGTGEQTAPESLKLSSVVRFAWGPELTARGSVGIYVFMLFASGLLAVDAAFPRALFYMQHSCDVRDPEPSDFYLSMQRVGWIVYPVLILIGHFIGVWQLP